MGNRGRLGGNELGMEGGGGGQNIQGVAGTDWEVRGGGDWGSAGWIEMEGNEG